MEGPVDETDLDQVRGFAIPPSQLAPPGVDEDEVSTSTRWGTEEPDTPVVDNRGRMPSYALATDVPEPRMSAESSAPPSPPKQAFTVLDAFAAPAGADPVTVYPVAKTAVASNPPPQLTRPHDGSYVNVVEEANRSSKTDESPNNSLNNLRAAAPAAPPPVVEEQVMRSAPPPVAAAASAPSGGARSGAHAAAAENWQQAAHAATPGRQKRLSHFVHELHAKEKAKAAMHNLGKWFGVSEDANLVRWNAENAEQQQAGAQAGGAAPMRPLTSMVASAATLVKQKAAKRMNHGQQKQGQQNQSRGIALEGGQPPQQPPRGGRGRGGDGWNGDNADAGFVKMQDVRGCGAQPQQQSRGVSGGGDPRRAVPAGGRDARVAAGSREAPALGPNAMRGVPANRGGGGGEGGYVAAMQAEAGDPKWDTNVRKQLSAIYEHRPYFTYFVSFVQIIVMIIAVSVHSLAPIAFGTSTSQGQVQGPDGNMQTVTVNKAGNFWIGVSPASLVLLAAKFAPCMRKDTVVQDRIIAPQLATEKASGCCIANTGQCYTATQSTCGSGGSSFFPNQPCGGAQCCQDYDESANTSPTWPNCAQKAVNSYTSGQDVMKASCTCTSNVRPCCIGLVGSCSLQTQSYCDFKQGTWHSDKTLCSQVDCFSDICGLIPFFKSNTPDQWYRVYLSLFLHAGFIHLFFVLLFQYSVTLDIERLAGCVRMACIFFLSGIGGYVVSATLTPYQVSAGATPACYGVLACLLVELFQSWQLLNSPWWELFKLLLLLAFALAIGLLPYVDNWGNIGGLVFGALSALVFLPYITFGRWDAARKRFLLVLGFLGVVVLMVLWNALLYTNQFSTCSWCTAFDCVDVVPNFCQENSQDELNRVI